MALFNAQVNTRHGWHNEQIIIPDDQLQQYARPVQRVVVREAAPQTHWGHAAAAGIGVILVGGIVYALCRSSVGRLVLIAGAILFLWMCNQFYHDSKQSAAAAAPIWSAQESAIA